MSAACAVFGRMIVVSGGHDSRVSKTVEIYDHKKNKWSYMPDMNKRRYDHASISVQNKLCMVGGSSNIVKCLTA